MTESVAPDAAAARCLAQALRADTVALVPSPAPSRVISGEPRCSELVLVDRPGLEVGVWEVTPGRFDSVKPDVGEVMHFVAGAGRIVHADGSVTDIEPGVTLSLQAGWSGRWDVAETVRKVYVIHSGPAGDIDAEA